MFILPGYSVGSIIVRLLVHWFNIHVYIARLQRWIQIIRLLVHWFNIHVCIARLQRWIQIIRLLVHWFNIHVYIARLQRWIHNHKIVGPIPTSGLMC